jgi:hypothetical protein
MFGSRRRQSTKASILRDASMTQWQRRARHPDRFSPVAMPDEAVRELDRCIRTQLSSDQLSSPGLSD